MKFTIKTEKPNEIESTLKIWQKEFGGDNEMVAKFGITTEIKFIKKENNVFEVTLEYSGKIPIFASVNDIFLKGSLMKALHNVDASVREI